MKLGPYQTLFLPPGTIGTGTLDFPKRPTPYLVQLASFLWLFDATVISRFGRLQVNGGAAITNQFLIDSEIGADALSQPTFVFGAALSSRSTAWPAGGSTTIGVSLPEGGLYVNPSQTLQFTLLAGVAGDALSRAWAQIRDVLDDPIFPAPIISKPRKGKTPEFMEH